jgi:hypothetical protein
MFSGQQRISIPDIYRQTRPALDFVLRERKTDYLHLLRVHATNQFNLPTAWMTVEQPVIFHPFAHGDSSVARFSAGAGFSMRWYMRLFGL